MLPLLELEDVTRRFPGVLALDRVDFDLEAGEVHALVGENGAGKSTLIQLVSGVLAPDSGRIVLEGRPVRLTGPVSARRRGIVAVHQEAEFFGALSVAENMALANGLPTGAFGRVRWRRVRADARAAVAALREPVDVRWPAARVGVAQRHLIQVASAVARRARIVILDEPTAALTEVEASWLFAQVERLRADGVGLIYISHRHEEIFRLADRISVLRDGRLVWTGAASEIDRAGLVRAMVGRDDPRTTRPRPPHSRQKTPRLRVRDLTDAQGRFEAVDLDVHAGEILGIYGLVGAGRSEWAQALFGLRRLARGRIEIDAYPQTFRTPGDAVAAGLSYVPEDRLRQGICPGLSVRANMVLSDPAATTLGPLAIAAVESLATREQVAALGIRLRDIAQPIGQLSGGNQQKVVLGRWLLIEPKVLLLDEPTRGVDVAAKAEIHRLVRQRADRGCAVVLISSELPEVLAHSDRIAVFRSGRVAGLFDARTATAEDLAEAALPRPPVAPEAPANRRRRRRLRPEFRGHEAGLIVVLAALAAALAATTGGRFASAANLLGVVANSATLTILALGAAAVMIAGGIDISVGALLALSAAVGGLVMGRHTRPEIGVPMGLLAGLATGVGGGMLNATLAIVGRVHPIVVTLGMLTVYRGLLISLTGGHVLGGLPAAFRRLATGHRDVLGVPVPGSVPIMLLAALAVYLWLAQTRSGRHLYAFGGNPRAARQVGIGRGRVWLTAFGVGGLCAALAGLLELAQNGSMQSGMGNGAELRAIAAAVIGGTAVDGGRGSVVGVVLGALLLSLLQNALVLWEVSRNHYDLVIGGLLLAAILVDRVLRRNGP